MKKISITLFTVISIMLLACNANQISKGKPYHLITLDPGHFHAALVQKTMYDNVDSVVHVYAKEGSDLNLHLKRINDYNTREDNPTRWKEEVYMGNDFFAKMIQEKKGNIVILSGNNEKKSDYILQSLQNGLNVLADKPMAIDADGFEKIKTSFEVADKNKLLLYDIMTERFEITTILLRELSMMPEIFGNLKEGTKDDPSVVKESVHFLYKYVSGNVLTRPDWFLDVSQQGEGIADVMTHLVDLVQWECFPGQPIDYKKDIQVNTAKHWPTDIGLSEFTTITHADHFPAYLSKNIVHDSVLQYYCNGEINYQLKNIHARTTVRWEYKSAEGSGDTYYALMKGTKASLIIQQGKDEQYKPVLYIRPSASEKNYEAVLQEAFKRIEQKYPGITLVKSGTMWKVGIPDKYKENHEEHFARVVKNFLMYLEKGKLPEWEAPNMLAKYYTTTKALELATKK
ncbi:MAG: oxidoreductase [Bacteroidota bacterium]|nr:oxidoreductase [Bacteroidota bacterium]